MLDFSFHLLVALASGNLVYPLIINSFKSVYTHLTGRFFHQYARVRLALRSGATPSATRRITATYWCG